jgi:outer membrane cobalamin receptor
MDTRLVNLGTVDVRGVDARVTLRPSTAVELGGSYQLALARARNDAASPWYDDPLDRLPAHRADAWLRATPARAVSGMIRGRYFGQSIDREMTVAGYALVEASAMATIAGDWMAVARCDDLLDRRPESRAGFRLPGRVLSLVVQGTWD